MNDRVLEFVVRGVAVPKGSGRAYTYQRRAEKGGGIGARVDHDNPKTKGWQREIALAAHVARATAKCQPFDGPVFVAAVFYLPRPKGLLTTRTASLAIPHTKKPDTDKLGRSLLDALTGVAWADDAQVTDLLIRKRYCGATDAPRAVVRVRSAHAEGGLYGRS